MSQLCKWTYLITIRKWENKLNVLLWLSLFKKNWSIKTAFYKFSSGWNFNRYVILLRDFFNINKVQQKMIYLNWINILNLTLWNKISFQIILPWNCACKINTTNNFVSSKMKSIVFSNYFLFWYHIIYILWIFFEVIGSYCFFFTIKSHA